MLDVWKMLVFTKFRKLCLYSGKEAVWDVEELESVKRWQQTDTSWDDLQSDCSNLIKFPEENTLLVFCVLWNWHPGTNLLQKMFIWGNVFIKQLGFIFKFMKIDNPTIYLTSVQVYCHYHKKEWELTKTTHHVCTDKKCATTENIFCNFQCEV